MNTYALVTGASKGIGRSIALLLAKKGYPVLLVARSEDDLKMLAHEIVTTYKVDVHWLSIDLSENDAAEKVRQWCTSNLYNISILINNAGYGLWGKFENADLNEQLNMIDLNINALIKLT